MPARPIEKGIPGIALLANLLLSKFVDHLPLHRLGKMFERQGVKIADSTLVDWIKAVCNLLAPLYDAPEREILLCHYLQMMAREKNLSASERLALRQELSRPVFDYLFEYLKTELLKVLPKSTIGSAIA